VLGGRLIVALFQSETAPPEDLTAPENVAHLAEAAKAALFEHTGGRRISHPRVRDDALVTVREKIRAITALTALVTARSGTCRPAMPISKSIWHRSSRSPHGWNTGFSTLRGA
jgi:hypothetical protein